MNEGALNTSSEKAIGEEFNTAVGERADMNEMMVLLKTNLVKHDPQIANIEVIQGSERKGDIPHSLASIDKVKTILG